MNGDCSGLESRSSGSRPQTSAAASEKVVQSGGGERRLDASGGPRSDQPSSIGLAPDTNRKSLDNVIAATVQLSDIVHSIDGVASDTPNKSVKFGEPLVSAKRDNPTPTKRSASRRIPILKHISACRSGKTGHLLVARPDSEVLPPVDDPRRSDEFLRTEAKIRALEKHSQLLEAAIKAMLMTRVNTVVNTEVIDYAISSQYPMDLPSRQDFMDSLRLEVAC